MSASLYQVNSFGIGSGGGSYSLFQSFSHPFFTRLLTITDQVLFVADRSANSFLHVSSNASNLFGIGEVNFKRHGLKLLLELLHPDDLELIKQVVAPEYDRIFNALPIKEKLRCKGTFTARFKKADGEFIKLLQQNIPLTLDEGKTHLELIVIMDISPFKQDDHLTYKHALIGQTGIVVVLSEGAHQTNRVLTKREIAVLKLAANGLSERQISEQLSISIYTVKSHKKNMIRKAGVKNVAELVKYAIANMIL